MKIKKLSLAISAILIAANVSTAFAGTINRVRIPTAGIKAPAGTTPTTPGLPTTPELPETPGEPTAPPVEASDRTLHLGYPLADWSTLDGKTVMYSPPGVQGDLIYVLAKVSHSGASLKEFNSAAYSISGAENLRISESPGYRSTCLELQYIENKWNCQYYFELILPDAKNTTMFTVQDLTINFTGVNTRPAVAALAINPRFGNLSNPGYLSPGTVLSRFTLKNTGDTPLQNMGIQVEGEWVRYESTVDTDECMPDLARGRECEIKLMLKNPSVAKNYVGSVTVNYINPRTGASGRQVLDFEQVVGK